MQISIRRTSGYADTATQGEIILQMLRSALRSGANVTIDFDGVTTATSSFANTAFVPLLDEFSFDQIKQRLRIVRSTRQINEMIKRRLDRESSNVAA
ncbi:STAS-like domain-containing protein [Rhodopseudomonas sp. B29]|uniref:STAS-like domain-containing protein n=1 Tax=Rhodopseudomonas sp. B29 TaxID=95607 RepID=UPI0003B4F5D6|nr:STAS-like domain-containing protein [Rhodopseudomonas sp. B29]